MILSKASFSVVQVVSREKMGGPLRFVWIEKDGTCVGANGNMIMAVEPLDREKLGLVPVAGEVDIDGPGVLVDSDVVTQVTKNMPRSAKGGVEMQFAVLSRCAEGAIEFACADRQQEKRVIGRMGRGVFPSWRQIIRGARNPDRSAVSVGGFVGSGLGSGRNRVCINRKDMLLLLGAMESACLDPSGDKATFIEWYDGTPAMGSGASAVGSGSVVGAGGGLVIRGVNYFTGQRAVGYMLPLDTNGEWLQDNIWERRSFGMSAGRKKVKKKRRVV